MKDTFEAPAPRVAGLAGELEDGPLRQELGLPPLIKQENAEPPVFEARLQFTGTGSEYFGIWAFNTLLTLLSLGIYSAWAKQRKARWFAQHTVLLGDRFDYHGVPLRILGGRLLALTLLALYSYGFLISPVLGWSVLALLVVAGPILFASAQRFRLANTSWRGLRFDFRPPTRRVYLVCVPMIALWLSGTALTALGASMGWILWGVVLLALGFPLAHARLKQLQHEYAWLGGTRFTFSAAAADFYGLYAKALFLLVIGALGAAMSMAALATVAKPSAMTPLWSILGGVLSAAAIWVAVWPYFAARMQQIVWSHTQWRNVRFRGEMTASSLWGLTFSQGWRVLFSAGLYWPFAAVAIARYRVESIFVQSAAPLADIGVQAMVDAPDSATGDASADFFSLDLGW
jgi:uncharacterized membrane protein YjgN (DUF898 family)